MNSTATESGPHEQDNTAEYRMKRSVYHDIWCGTQHGFSKCDCTPGRSYNVDSKEQPMAASLPATTDIAQIEQKHQSTLTGLTERLNGLLAKETNIRDRIKRLGKLTPAIAEEWKELAATALTEDTAAKRLLDQMEAERVAMKAPLLEATRKQDSFWQKMMTPAATVRAACMGIGVKLSDGGIVGRYNREQQRIAQAKQREDEQRKREEAERQRKLEADALLAQAAATPEPEMAEELVQAAIEVEQAPIIPVASATVVPEKIEGSSLSKEKPVLKSISDAYAMMQWFMASRERFESIWPTNDKFQKFIESTVNKALDKGLDVPGIEKHMKSGGRNIER